MSHYFTNDKHAHDYRSIKYELNGTSYAFKTDAGVFSRDNVDYGSDLLIKTVLEDLEERSPTSMIDMGAGYGVISIVLSDQLNIHATAVDVNLNALDLTKQNAKQFNVTAMTREEYDNASVSPDLYITNPPFRAGKPVVMEIIQDAHQRLTQDGNFYMVVQKKQGMPSYKKAIEQLFGNVEVLKKSKGYYILKAAKKNFNNWLDKWMML